MRKSKKKINSHQGKKQTNRLSKVVLYPLVNHFFKHGSIHKIIFLLRGEGTVCSNGFYADISSQRQVQQYKSYHV